MARPRFRDSTLGLGSLFGLMYFVQGVGEPTEGLVAQPMRSLLKSWGHSTGEIAAFAALLGVPWVLKPLYGLLTDFVPLRGSRRQSYLVLATSATTAALLVLYLSPLPAGATRWLFGLLLVPAVGIAFSDVVIDALMVEKGQPRGLTGRLQSVQWAALYTATVGTGVLGGYLSQHGQQQLGFLLCACAVSVTLLLAILFARDDPQRAPPLELRSAGSALWEAARQPGLVAVGAFLFLWTFNPFSSTVLYVHMTRELGLSEQFYGNTVSLSGVASVVAAVGYGLYCRRVPFRWLIHASILLGIASTLAYWGLSGRASALLIAAAVGLTYMTATLVQLDLAARVCPPRVAGTVFAALMALSNASYALASAAGGYLYDSWSDAWGSAVAFNALVGAGALATSACWLLVPALRRAGADR